MEAAKPAICWQLFTNLQGHHIPEALYLHGTFTTGLGQLPTIMYIPFTCRHTLTHNMKNLETKILNKCNIHACKKHLRCSSISTLPAVINHHIRSGELKLYKFLILVPAPASVTPGQRLVVYTSPITSGRRLDKPQGISTWDGKCLASISSSRGWRTQLMLPQFNYTCFQRRHNI
jgi:hypothetical protein